MAKERGAKKISELEEALDFSNIAVDDGTPIGKRITKDGLKNLMASEGAQLKSVQGGTVGSPTSLVAPETTEYRWMKASPGEYTFGANPYSAAVGKEWIFEWLSGTWSLKDMGELPVNPISNIVQKEGDKSTSQKAVFDYINEKGDSIGNQNVAGFTTDYVQAIQSVIFDKVFIKESQVKKVTVFSPVAGPISLRTYTKSGNVVTVYKSIIVDLVVGINVFDLSSLDLIGPTGGVAGFTVNNTTLTGRVGFNTSFPNGNVYIHNADTSSFTLPAKSTSASVGVYFEFGNTGLVPRVGELESKIQNFNGIDITKMFVASNGFTPDFVSNPDYMRLSFTSGNQSVVVTDVIKENEEKYLTFTAKTLSGSISLIVGFFSSTLMPPITTKVAVTSVEQEFSIPIKGHASMDIYIGSLMSDNTGATVLIKEIGLKNEDSLYVLDKRLAVLEGVNVTMPDSFLTDTIFKSISRYDKKSRTFKYMTDSLISNGSGGPIPNIEPPHESPPRLLDGNGLARRFYDLISWNKPKWRRFSHPSWTKTGTWTSFNNNTVWEGTGLTDIYHKNETPGSYTEMTVPLGNENFALICRIGASSGVINIYVNGVLKTTVNTLKAGAGHTGNPLHKVEINDLPSGQDNVIRIENAPANTNPIYAWGGCYWTGTTAFVFNVAHGGHTLSEYLIQHFSDEVTDQMPDAVIMELPLMNEAGRKLPHLAVYALNVMLDRLKDVEILTMSCNPMGLTQNKLINYYTLDQKIYKDQLKQILYDRNVSYVGIQEAFEKTGISLGYTPESGELGFKYTTDGQHQNPEGMRKWWNILLPIFKGMPLYNEV